MAGLMQQPGMEQPPQEQAPQDPMAEEQMPQEQMPEDEEPLVEEEDDAALQQAYAFVHEKLYADDYAGQMAEIFKDAGAAPQIVAQMTYKLSQAADTKTGAQIAEENLLPLGLFTMTELFEVAEAAGADVKADTVSKAMKALILIFLEDHDMDSTEMQAALSAVDDKDFAKFAKENQDKEFVDE